MKSKISPSDLSSSGIYIITNSINDKVYVGSAKCFRLRVAGHKYTLSKGKHNRRFQNFVDKYGVDTLSISVLELCSEQDLLIREQYWIDFYESWKSSKGFNVAKIAGSNLGCKMPESHKEACRVRMIENTNSVGRKWTEEERRGISERSKDMWKANRLKMLQACEKSGKARRGVNMWEDKKHPMLGLFGRENPNYGKKRSPEFCELMSKIATEKNGMRGKKLSKELVADIVKRNSKPVELVDGDGSVIAEYSSAAKAQIEHGLTAGSVSRVCSGEYKHTHGLIFRFKKIE